MAATDRQTGYNSEVAIKAPCVVATTANITLSGTQTIDGVAVVADDRVLVKDQTDGTENGIYVVSASSWERAVDFNGNTDVVQGTLVYVHSGTTNVGSWRVTADDPITIDTSNITFAISGLSTTVTEYAASLLNDSDAATARATLDAVGRTGNETVAGIKTFTGENTFTGINTFTGENFFTPVQHFTAGIGPNYIQNIGLTASVASKALTIALKTKALADPSAGSPVELSFRHPTLTTGTYNVRSATAATSVVAPSGASFGWATSQTGYLYVYALDNAGTIEAIISGSNHWDESKLHNTTAITTGADSISVLYSTTSRTSVPIRYIGRIKIQTGAVAGEWDNEDTEVALSNDLRGSSQGVSVASATTTDIWGGGDSLHITGTTTITSFGTAPYAGASKRIIFDGACQLTHSANLNVPGGLNYTTSAGDSFIVYADTTTQMDLVSPTSAFLPSAVAGSYVSGGTDEETTTTAIVLTNVRRTRVPYGGTFTVGFTMHHSTGGANVVYGKIYVNSIAVGTERSNNDTTYITTYTEDFTVVAGDIIELALRTSGSGTAYASNFRIMENKPPAAFSKLL